MIGAILNPKVTSFQMRILTLNISAALIWFMLQFLPYSEGFAALQATIRHIASERSQQKLLYQSSSYVDSLSKTKNDVSEVSCDALGGTIKRIKVENEDENFLAKVSVPTFAAFKNYGDDSNNVKSLNSAAASLNPKRMGLEGLVPGAFLVENAISIQSCEEIIGACEKVRFGKFNAGRNRHGAIQLLVTPEAVDSVGSSIFPFIDMDIINPLARCQTEGMDGVEHDVVG